MGNRKFFGENFETFPNAHVSSREAFKLDMRLAQQVASRRGPNLPEAFMNSEDDDLYVKDEVGFG